MVEIDLEYEHWRRKVRLFGLAVAVFLNGVAIVILLLEKVIL